jgi:hypothetical protein
LREFVGQERILMVLASLVEGQGSNPEDRLKDQAATRGGMVAEARTGKRFPLELPIKIHNESARGDASGTTGNLSAAGVYIRADSSLAIGSPVEFEITLPADVTGGQENVVIQCKGRVVRTDPTGTSDDGKGVACVIDSYEFVRHG